MDIYQHRRQRLNDLINDSYGGVRRKLCDAIGWSESRLSQLLSTTYRGGQVFSEKTARKLETDLGLEWMYFDKGAAQPAKPEEAVLPGVGKVIVLGDDEEHEDVVRIRKVKLRLSAGIRGFQAELDHSSFGSILAPKRWLESKGYSLERLVAVDIKGESMAPTLFEGDTVVVNTADTTPVDGGVYAVNYEGEAVVKRLSRDAGDWWLMSDNADQRKYHRKVCRGDDCIIVGRVVRKQSDYL